MLKKGNLNIKWKEDEAENSHWYDTIDFKKIATPPHIKKARGWRFDFASYENLHQKAMTIKERLPYLYTNENDVYKDAHYIGMYILERLITDDERYKEFDEIISITSNGDRKSLLKSFAREQFLKFYEEFVTGIISEEVLLEMMSKIASTITSEKIKRWFLDDCEMILTSDHEARKITGKLQKREYRERIAAAKERGLPAIDM